MNEITKKERQIRGEIEAAIAIAVTIVIWTYPDMVVGVLC